MAGADYSPNVNENASSKSLFFAITLGGMIPLIIMFISGILMSASMSDLATNPNPLELISKALPPYLAFPYYIVSLGGLLPQ